MWFLEVLVAIHLGHYCFLALDASGKKATCQQQIRRWTTTNTTLCNKLRKTLINIRTRFMIPILITYPKTNREKEKNKKRSLTSFAIWNNKTTICIYVLLQFDHKLLECAPLCDSTGLMLSTDEKVALILYNGKITPYLRASTSSSS